MAKSLEQEIKDQFAKVFVKKNWKTFKSIADYYFEKSALLKKKDINAKKEHKLLIRNIQKRLFLGIGTELLIKACYLKNDYVINKPIDKDNNKATLIPFKDIPLDQLNSSDTFTLGPLLSNLKSIVEFSDWKTVEKGLKILMVFRNKEGHVAVLNHEYIKSNYDDIEESLRLVYQEVFDEEIEFKISMEKNAKGKFVIK